MGQRLRYAFFLSFALFTMSASSAAAAPMTFTVTNTTDAAGGSLRAAIVASNANAPGGLQHNTINFNISVAEDPQTIDLLSALPALTEPVTINGYSEPGASANTLSAGDNAKILIVLDGAGAGSDADGLLVGSGGAGSTIEGLDIYGFSLDGIELQGGGDLITGNDIGFATSGVPSTNAIDGLHISNSSYSTIGGQTPAARNVISGNTLAGVHIVGTTAAPAVGNVVQGNFVGTDTGGDAQDGNGRCGACTDVGGVEISGGDGNTIGGTSAAASNVISGNGSGLDMDDGAESNVVQDNYIGVGADGATAVPNLDYGVDVRSDDNRAPPLGPGQLNEPASSGNIIGLNPAAPSTGAGNLIADNGGDGVRVDDSFLPNNTSPISNSGNSVLGNSIYSDGGAGIDLKGGSGAVLPNNRMTAPTITAATPASAPTLIQGTLSRPASPNMTIRIELFSSASCGASSSGQGQTFLGATTVTTDSSGNASFSASVTPLTPGQVVTATATNTTADPSSQSGSVNVFNTSEFSACFALPTQTATEPVVSNATESHRRWREGRRLATISRKRKGPVGTTFTFTLNEQASVAFAFTRRTSGRKVHGSCVAPTKRNHHQHACKRNVFAGRLTFTSHAGVNKVAFQGRLSRSKKLKPGSYTLTIVATGASGQGSKPVSLSFTVV